MNDTRLRAIGYARVSKADTKRPGREKHSIPAQVEAIKRAADYNEWTLLGIEVDNGKTGANTKRDGLQACLSLLAEGEAEMLVIARLDRLSRAVADFDTILKTADKQGWFVSVLDQKIDTSTAAGWLAASVTALVSEYERMVISERTTAALAVIKASGRQLGQPSPIPVELQRRILRLHSRGKSASAIARTLSIEGIRTPTGKDTWHHSVIVDLIRRQAAS